MEKELGAYLKDAYQPDAIILHGSRATGNERVHSDWDFILLYTHNDTPGNFREMVNEHNVEVQSVVLPVDDILDTFDSKLQHARVVFEKDGEGTLLLERAQALYAKGFEWPASWPTGPHLWMQGRVDGMRDSLGNNEVYFRYLSQLYIRAINYWYVVLHKEYSQPVYLALPDIAERDPRYRALLAQLADPAIAYSEKVEVAQRMVEHVFGSAVR